MTNNSLTITWNAVSYGEGIKEYEIYRDGVSVGTRVGTSFADSGLAPETTYEYQVKAIGNNDLESEFSEGFSATTEPEQESGD